MFTSPLPPRLRAHSSGARASTENGAPSTTATEPPSPSTPVLSFGDSENGLPTAAPSHAESDLNRGLPPSAHTGQGSGMLRRTVANVHLLGSLSSTTSSNSIDGNRLSLQAGPLTTTSRFSSTNTEFPQPTPQGDAMSTDLGSRPYGDGRVSSFAFSVTSSLEVQPPSSPRE